MVGNLAKKGRWPRFTFFVDFSWVGHSALRGALGQLRSDPASLRGVAAAAMVQWNSSSADDESTPIMHPVRMELAPHARLGRRMAASTAIFVLLVFHVSMVTIGALNWNAACDEQLWLFLVIYGGVGLLFVYLLFREWLYYARLSSLPTLANLILLIVFYALLSTAGGFLTVRATVSWPTTWSSLRGRHFL